MKSILAFILSCIVTLTQSTDQTQFPVTNLGYPFRYFIPSTYAKTHDASASQLMFRKSLIEYVFISNFGFGGATIDTWESKTGSYKSPVLGSIITEKVVVAEVYTNDEELNKPTTNAELSLTKFDELINALTIFTCVWWTQESYIYTRNTEVQEVQCKHAKDYIFPTVWTFCTDNVFTCNLYLDPYDEAINGKWSPSQCQKMNITTTAQEDDLHVLFEICIDASSDIDDDDDAAVNVDVDVNVGDQSYIMYVLIATIIVLVLVIIGVVVYYHRALKPRRRYGYGQAATTDEE